MVSASGDLVARLWVGKSGGGKRADFDSLFQHLGKELRQWFSHSYSHSVQPQKVCM
jgi:hypothetical protein